MTLVQKNRKEKQETKKPQAQIRTSQQKNEKGNKTRNEKIQKKNNDENKNLDVN